MSNSGAQAGDGYVRAKRASLEPEEVASELILPGQSRSVPAPRRALLAGDTADRPRMSSAESAAASTSVLHPRRRAPIRALLSRLLFGEDTTPRRAMVDPDELLAAELFRLASLDPRWGFMQSARQVDGVTELDHWAIGPGGVYLLNAKHLPGSRLYVAGDQFFVDGKDQPFVPQMRSEARRNADLMSISARWDVGVTGVIVPFNDRKLTVEHNPDDVAVIDEVDVAQWLVNRPEQFGKRQILTAFSAARDATVAMPRFTV